jgi:hypothetical protein
MPGSAAAATSEFINVKRGDSVKGLFLTKCSPQDIVEWPVETGEKPVGQEFQWLAAGCARKMPKPDKFCHISSFIGGFCSAIEPCDSQPWIRR